MSDEPPTGEPYLRVEDVAERLGLPLSVLMGRVEAGDIPSHREQDGDRVHYWLRLGDLGIDAWDDRASPEEVDEGAAHVGNAIQSSFNPGEPPRLADDSPWSLDGGLPSQWPGMEEGNSPQDAEQPAPPGALAQPARREPQEPPEWLRMPVEEHSPDNAPTATVARATAIQGPAPPDPPATADPVRDAELDGPGDGEPAGTPEAPRPEPQPTATVAGAAAAEENDDAQAGELTALAPRTPSHLPVPRPAPRVDLFEPSSPRGDLATMSLDARELVAGLLDRWERTLEQRIYTEQRQRFESELTARQNTVRQLQMELHTARAEHAAAQADKDRVLAEKERELADREREVADAKRHAVESSARRRRWFRRTDD